MPQDFAVAAAARLLDGGLVVTALLVTALLLAGCTAARLVAALLPEAGRPGELVAVTVAIWNPYVAERLLQGHWSLLLGYGCLPAVAAAMRTLRTDGDRAAAFALTGWVALAGLTPTGLLLAAVTGAAAALGAGAGWSRRRALALLALPVLAAALPWLTVFRGTAMPGAAAGVAAFAPRAEPGLGTLGSLAGLAGIWNADAVPGSRTTGLATLATALLLAMLAVGLPAARRAGGARPLLALAVGSVATAALLATGPGRAALTAAIDAVPGLGVLRDGQKWVALALPGYALAGAGAVLGLRRFLLPGVAAAACCAVPLLGLPDLAGGVGGRVHPVHYPSGFAATAAAIDADPRPVAVLPAGTMRRFSWAGPAPVLDPLPRWVRADVLATGDLDVAGRTVPGEGAHARAVQDLLLAGAAPATLAAAGVGWVVVEHGTPGALGHSAATLDRLPVVYRDGDLTLYRVGGQAPGATPARRRAAVAVHLGWLSVLVGGAVGAVTTRRLRRPGRG